MGEVLDTRHARGIEFNMYNFANNDVQKRAMELYDIALKK